MRNSKIKSANTLIVCLLQIRAAKNIKEANLNILKNQLQKIPKNVDWILLPEMWLTTAYKEEPKDELKRTEEALIFLKSYAKKHKVSFSGSHLVKKGTLNTNTAFWVDSSGNLSGTYDKIHLFKIGDEHKKFVSGSSYKIFSSDFGKFAFAICYDIRFPEFIRSLILKGARFLIIPSAWPKARLDHYLTLLKARAIENQCFIISCNKVGKNEKGILNGGHSVVFDPWGTKILELGGIEGFGVVEVDLNRVEEIRQKFPVLQCRRSDLY